VAVERARPPVAVFVPDRLDLVKGPPAHRRERIDRFVGSLWPASAGARATYSRALGQRNALLARVRAGGAATGQLDAWDRQLARAGSELMASRVAAVDQLAPRFAARAAELGLAKEAEVRYRPRAGGHTPAELARELSERRAQDLERGFTTHGPHRDDIALLHGGRPLRAYGSQGQQRLALLALLFAERDALAERGRIPLMLLDDVMSELDAARRHRIVEAVRADGQAVITATDPDQVPRARGAETAIVVVEPGTIRPAPRAVAA
jgi:DNA replication and repair protein RecF